MTLAVRVIPCLDVDNGRVVKGVNFQNLRDAGDPVEMAKIYGEEGADELTFLDITASSGNRETTYDVRRGTGIDAVEWAHRAAELGAGEILLNSMDADGTKDGYDVEMIEAVRKHVTVPVIASGGAGGLADFPPAVAAGAGAGPAASVLHFRLPRDGEA